MKLEIPAAVSVWFNLIMNIRNCSVPLFNFEDVLRLMKVTLVLHGHNESITSWGELHNALFCMRNRFKSRNIMFKLLNNVFLWYQY